MPSTTDYKTCPNGVALFLNLVLTKFLNSCPIDNILHKSYIINLAKSLRCPFLSHEGKGWSHKSSICQMLLLDLTTHIERCLYCCESGTLVPACQSNAFGKRACTLPVAVQIAPKLTQYAWYRCAEQVYSILQGQQGIVNMLSWTEHVNIRKVYQCRMKIFAP